MSAPEPLRPPAPRGAIIARDYGRARPTAQSVSARYNRLMGWLKLVLPGVAALLILIVAAWPLMSPRHDRIPIGYSTVTQEEIDQLRMINPRFVGIDGRNQPFSITAESATQSDGKQGVVQLEQPKADITLHNGTWLALTAADGVFFQKEQIVDLSGNVSLFHDAGYEFRTEFAHLDLGTGTGRGDKPVEGQGPFGALKSQGFEILDKGARVIFTGKAKMTIFSRNQQQPRRK